MEEKILAALLDLRIVLGELQACLGDIDEAIRKLMAVQLDALEAKKGQVSGVDPGDKKEGSAPDS